MEETTTQRTIIDRLGSKFPDDKVKTKTGQSGIKMSYISHALVTERLNEIDPQWSMRHVETHTYTGHDGRLHCEGVTIEMTVGGATRVESGGPQRQDGFANEVKNARSDAIKRAAMRFGVALYMWDKMIDAEFDEDVYPDYQAPAASPAPTPIRQPNNVVASPAMARVNEVAGAANVPAKGQARPPQQAAQRVPPPQPNEGAYGSHAPSKCSLATVNEYLKANGFQGGNTGECIKELERWVSEAFHTDAKVIGTGPVEDPKWGPRVWPSDIYNYAFHFISQCDVPEEAAAAVSAAAGGIHLPDDDNIPF